MTWRETKYYDTPSLSSLSALLEKMPGNIISTSIVCCRNIISHFPHCLTPQSSHLTPHTSYLFNFRRARPGGVRPNPGAVGVDGVGWDGDDEKGEAAEAVGERCHCVALSLSLCWSSHWSRLHPSQGTHRLTEPSEKLRTGPGHSHVCCWWSGGVVVVLGHLTSC